VDVLRWVRLQPHPPVHLVLSDECLRARLGTHRVEVRVALGHLAAAVPHVDRLAEMLDGVGRLAREALAARCVDPSGD
jgi:hypothetical protein